MRTCTGCHERKPNADFSTNGKGKRKYRCRLCRNADERYRVHMINERRPLVMFGWPAP